MNEKICRLCLQTISGSYQTIGQSLKITLKLNVDISKDAVQCSECTNNLEAFLKFKSACDYVGDLKEDINFDPEKIVITSNLKSEESESKHEVKCCFCTKTSGREFLTSLNESKEHKFLVDVLKEHIPKLNLNVTEELLTCVTCLDALQDVLSFVLICLEVEQKINKYVEIKGTSDEGHIELKDVQQFICEQTVKFENESVDVKELGERWDQFQDGCVMQAEAEIKFEKEVEDHKLFIKTEEVVIKSEDSKCDSIQEPSTIIETDDGSLDISVFKSQRRHKKCVNRCEVTYENSDGKTTNQKAYLGEHKLFKCKLCSYEAKDTDELKQHKLLHKSSSNVTMFKCELCPYEAKRRDHIKRHELTHKSTSELTMCKCEVCPFQTKRRDVLKRHTLTHKRTSEFKCDLCQYETKYRHCLKEHKLVHSTAEAITMFKCELCSYETKCWSYLNRHKFIHKSISEETMFKCEMCPFKTTRQRYLKQHKLIHKSSSDVTIFKCELCPYETKRRQSIKLHTLIHKCTFEITMFKCEACPYETKRRDYLKQHELTHKSASELTMFKCELCTFETKRRDILKRHMSTHKGTSELKMFKCQACQYETKRRDVLKRHTLTHKCTSELAMF